MFEFFSALDAFFWSNIAFVLILGLGIFFTVKMRFFQVRALPGLLKLFWSFVGKSKGVGVHPLFAFFASVGGMIGIGNVVGIATALQMGGPGALFWVWIAAWLGSILKYCEIYLGLKHRVPNDRGSYDGGPIYFLKAAFNWKWISGVVAILLCIYGVEIYQFSVVTECVSLSWDVNRLWVVAALLSLVLAAGIGGVKRIGRICCYVMPVFVVGYVLMILWVVLNEAHLLPGIFALVFKSAFTGHAATGGFVGSSMILAIQHGMARAAYSADLGIGYDSIIHSESNTVYPERQAGLALLGVFVDNLICTMSLLLVLVSGIWKTDLGTLQWVQASLARYFPYMDVFIPIFLSVVGYTTILAYFCVGMKCARYLWPKFGEKTYVIYASASFLFFSFFDPSRALLVMSISGALLLIFNLSGIYRLRHQIPNLELKREVIQ